MQIGEGTLMGALRLAIHAPSVHNSQPWAWRVCGNTVDLYADPSRQVPATDPMGRDLVMSCGATLHHLVVALAAHGWASHVHRLPDPHRPDHLAIVELAPGTPSKSDVDLAAVIPQRRTDRRRFSPWPVPAEVIGEMTELAEGAGLALQTVTEPRLRWRLYKAIAAAAETQEADPRYAAELATWTGRPAGATDGVPSRNAPSAAPARGRMPMRAFAHPGIDESPGRGEPENATLLLLSTYTDTRTSWLRAGEITSAITLTATLAGIANSPLTQPLEVNETRAFVRERVTTAKTAHPQILLRIGWALPDAGELPATPRRPLTDVVTVDR